MIRVLVVDGSPLMAWLVRRVAPCDVEVVAAASLREASRILADSPPDAAVFNLSPCHLGWRSLVETCLQREPQIPFLCSSALEHDEMHDHSLPCRIGDHLPKSVPVEELRRRIATLCDEARSPGRLELRFQCEPSPDRPCTHRRRRRDASDTHDPG